MAYEYPTGVHIQPPGPPLVQIGGVTPTIIPTGRNMALPAQPRTAAYAAQGMYRPQGLSSGQKLAIGAAAIGVAFIVAKKNRWL